MQTIICPHCSQRYDVGPEYSGNAFQCSRCGAPIFVPAEEPTAVPGLPPQNGGKQSAAEPKQIAAELRTQTEILRATLARTEKIHWWVKVIGFPTLLLLFLIVFCFFAGCASGFIQSALSR